MQQDDIAARIEAFDNANGGGVGYYEGKGAYHLYLLETEAPVARLKPTGNNDEIRLGYWSHRHEYGRMSMTWAASSCPSTTRSSS